MNIIASVPPTDHGWLGAVSKNAKAEAEKYKDVKFELLQAADADSQAQQVEQAIAKKPDVLVVLPQDGAALTPVAQKAERAGIPVVNIDRTFTKPDAATATVLGDNYQIGALAADYIAERAEVQGQRRGDPGAGRDLGHDRPHQGLRRRSSRRLPGGRHQDRRQAAGRLQPRHRAQGDGEHPPGREEIDAVYTHDDDMAQGVVQAISNAGRDKEMFLTGVGGSQDAMKQIKAGGLYRATFLYNPNMAATGVNMARLIALGEGFSELVPPEVPRQLVVPAAVVTKDNVGEYEKYAFN